MYYIFMDNYRGFSKALLRLGSANFLVGENSTGKSSILSLLRIFSTPSFWINPSFSTASDIDLGGFRDIISVCSGGRSHFTVGALYKSEPSNEDDPTEGWGFILMTFVDNENRPRMSRYARFAGHRLVKLHLGPRTAKYKKESPTLSGLAPESVKELLLQTAQDLPNDAGGYRRIPAAVGGSHAGMLWLLADANREKGELLLELTDAFGLDQPLVQQLTSFAPIRAKPKRIYPSTGVDFTPEGDHTPYLIRTTLSAQAKKLDTVDLLQEFGDTSGLFKSVRAHTYGREAGAPFEVQVELWDSLLNISNVGYGVSQALPVVMEMLTGREEQWFAFQQPEVHLHPKAQAALGQLMHHMIILKKHRYIIETHSDYLVDRFRLSLKKEGQPEDAQVLFFERTPDGNRHHVLPIDKKGQYPENQPAAFRDFFINEQLELLGV